MAKLQSGRVGSWRGRWRRCGIAALSLIACGASPARPHSPPVGRIHLALSQQSESALNDYRWFHRHPELSNQERDTAERVAAGLEAAGLEVHRGVGGHGVLALLRGGKPGQGPLVLYRADLDALPVTERTGLEYSSQVPGVMHACGHDVHLAVALASLRAMSDLRSAWSGTILFVAQPAEELGEGAARILADSRFRELIGREGKPRVALALHNSADLPAGSLGISGGYVTANVDSVDIRFFGKGGHGAKPHESIDPIVMAAEAVMQMQTIVSRRIPPTKPGVVTVGKLQAGTKHNIIPPSAELQLTVRSYDEATRQVLLGEIRHIAESLAISYHAPRPPEVVVDPQATPAGFNHEAWAQRLQRRFVERFGRHAVQPSPATLGGEDFARYSRTLGVPGVMWRLGAADPEALATKSRSELPGLHSDRWAPDAERALPVGVLSVVVALLEALTPTDG